MISAMFLTLVSMYGCAGANEYEKATISYKATGDILHTTFVTLKSLHDGNVINDDDYISGLILLNKAIAAHDAVGKALEAVLDVPPLPDGADIDTMELQEARKLAAEAMYKKATTDYSMVIQELRNLITEFSGKGGE